ncbi:MAG: uracil-DNA glycosylase family protein [Ferruginibacter sp.]
MITFADKVIAFNQSLDFKGILPTGITMMNPFKEDKNVLPLSSEFYRKYYSDDHPRYIILGINPGRFGGGITGIPFTDTKRLKDKCLMKYPGKETHEPSSVFVYEVIDAYGGVEAFYKDFYINSICPLGFTATGINRKEKNYNYYDSKELTEVVQEFILESIQAQIAFGVNTNIGFCFGNGKNEQFLRKLNDDQKLFKKIVALEHPRFIMQYKSKSKKFYIDKYVATFRQAAEY